MAEIGRLEILERMTRESLKGKWKQNHTKRWLIILICLNIILGIVLCVVINYFCNKLSVVESNMSLTEVAIIEGDSNLDLDKIEYDFHSNPAYDETLSVYELNHEKRDIVFAGDSITKRYLLSEFFPELQILNRGIGSDVSAGLLNRFDEVLKHEPKKVFIWIGINDICIGIDVGDTIKNVKECIEMAKEKNISIYVLSVLPTNKEINVNENVKELNEEYEQLCAEEDVMFIELYDFFVDDYGEVILEYYEPDGVHLNIRGYTVVTSIIEKYVYDK